MNFFVGEKLRHMCVFHDHINSQTYTHIHVHLVCKGNLFETPSNPWYGIAMQVDDDNWKICFTLMNYQVANCTCGGMASHANCNDLSIQQVEMVSFDTLFGFGT